MGIIAPQPPKPYPIMEMFIGLTKFIETRKPYLTDRLRKDMSAFENNHMPVFFAVGKIERKSSVLPKEEIYASRRGYPDSLVWFPSYRLGNGMYLVGPDIFRIDYSRVLCMKELNFNCLVIKF